MTTKRKWSAKVDTDSTHPDEGLFKKSPKVIATALASKKVSPKGPGSGMRMLTFYINRAGKNLPAERKTALNKAKIILSGIIEDQKEKNSPATRSVKKSTTKKTPRKAAKRSTRTTRPGMKAAKKAA